MTIYIATDGSYSDYHIEEVFTNREQAMLYCALHECTLEEYEADKVKLDSDKPVTYRWTAWFDYNGDFYEVYKGRICIAEPPKFNYNPWRMKFCLTFTLAEDKDEEQAKKIACDFMAEALYNAVEEGNYPWIKQRKED